MIALENENVINDFPFVLQASSPDEKAFVESCRDFGVVYHGTDSAGFHAFVVLIAFDSCSKLKMRNTNHFAFHVLKIVTVFDRSGTRYRVLDVLGFDSDRKCMSVILQSIQGNGENSTAFDPERGVCGSVNNMALPPQSDVEAAKGDLLITSLFRNQETLKKVSLTPDYVMDRVTDFASAGLRTLVMGARYSPPEEWSQLKSQLDSARNKLDGRDEALSEAYKKIERELVLVGCTGIEDKLQDGVPETLIALRNAGIQIWILTGDKEETAVNISYSAGHFAPGLPTVRVTQQNSLRECIDTINTQIERVQESQRIQPNYAFGLVIDGQSLNFALTVS
ncbi:unnamed protein product [Hymenolepis diminuta]|uniref:Uncharacterized protein n=1 Tax=Hymenolepis diminuta TaxID=6216 RepID=A0A3P6ZAK4_HYMDI|nr:unnamed protein product [Hymenolepis diminuta]